jgi:hypothetical protein
MAHPETRLCVYNFMPKEQWKDVRGFENLYKISNKGRIYTNHRHRMKVPNKRLYINYNLYKKGRLYGFSAHRLVAKHFIPNPQKLPQVNHKDCNKYNNNIENLEWCNNSHNQKHAYKMGRQVGANKNPVRGEKHPQHKLTEKDVLFLRQTKRNNKYYCNLYHISNTVLKEVRNKKIWSWLS